MTTPTFFEFKTSDGLLLPGLFYEAKGSKKVAIHLHGNGSSSVFYNEREKRVLADALNKVGVSFFRFNNRGAHIIKKLEVTKKGKTDKKYFGCAFEKIKEAVIDIEGAIGYLKSLGYKEFYLIGSSTGANKACIFNYYKPKNEIKKFILTSAGDDTGIYYSILGKEKFNRLLKEAKQKIAKRQGEEFVKELLPEEIFSYKAFFDTCNPDGDYNVFPYYEVLNNTKLSKKPHFRHFKSIKRPTLVVYGEIDEYAYGKVPEIVEILKGQKPEFDYKIIKGANHGFDGYEKELASILSTWLRK